MTCLFPIGKTESGEPIPCEREVEYIAKNKKTGKVKYACKSHVKCYKIGYEVNAFSGRSVSEG